MAGHWEKAGLPECKDGPASGMSVPWAGHPGVWRIPPVAQWDGDGPRWAEDPSRLSRSGKNDRRQDERRRPTARRRTAELFQGCPSPPPKLNRGHGHAIVTRLFPRSVNAPHTRPPLGDNGHGRNVEGDGGNTAYLCGFRNGENLTLCAISTAHYTWRTRRGVAVTDGPADLLTLGLEGNKGFGHGRLNAYPGLMPTRCAPSTTMACPVANAPSVELSHNTADAISSGLPKRQSALEQSCCHTRWARPRRRVQSSAYR
jgi:hypothetical protein